MAQGWRACPTLTCHLSKWKLHVLCKRSNGGASNVTVRFQTANGTAAAPDYQAVDTTVAFGVGESTKRVLVPIHYLDAEFEGTRPETVLLTLRDYQGGASPVEATRC